jgi:putative OPT family oligopeptide transporter
MAQPLARTPVVADEPTHAPYVPASEAPAELTPGAVVLGILLGLVFSASSVYLALKIGLTVSASIPISVLSITIFRWLARAFGAKPATILQNNIVQTTGSAGESIAAGVVFTLPALLLLGYELPWPTVAAVGLIGGLLGVLLMIPLRYSLIVKEHHALKYPEGTAAAEVLIVGEERGVQAQTVFMGFGLGALYKFLNAGMKLWADVPARIIQRALPDGRRELFGEIRAEISPELTGVGFIIGPRIAGYLFAGGVISYFVLIPAIKMFGAGLTSTILPFDTKLIKDMSPSEIRASYVYFIGAGAVTAAGIISLGKALPTIWQALVGGLRGIRGAGAETSGAAVPRTQRDLPMTLVIGGVLVAIVLLSVLPMIHINPLGAILAIFFAFLFVTVSSRITGQIGASANPISGMTVAAVLMTALIFLAIGWTRPEHRVLALSIGGVVCVAAAVAGATSQDLKTGFLVGATPARQQIGLAFGVATSALLIGLTIQALDRAYTTVVRHDYAGISIPAANVDAAPVALRDGRVVASAPGDTGTYRVAHLYEQTGNAPAGRYLVDASGAIRYHIDPGIGGRENTDYTNRRVEKLDSPKSQIMSLVVDGILTQKLPWGLILIGTFFAIALEILGIPSLPVAVGVYLPISTSATMFMGGVIRWLVERRLAPEEREGPAADSGPGVLFSSGLIAGGAIMGVLLAALAASPKHYEQKIDVSSALGSLATNPAMAVIVYVIALAVPLYLVARRRRT